MSATQLNIDGFRAINDLGKHYDSLNPFVIFIANDMLYILCLALLVYWFTRTNKNRMMVIQGVIAFILAEVLGKIAGKFYSHFQPFVDLSHVNKLIHHSINNAFPSDHSILFFSICFSIWLVRRKDGWVWMIIAILVGISRIWVGVHYPGDVLVGAIIGIGSALVSFWLVPKLSFIKIVLSKYEKIEQSVLPTRKKSEH